MDGIYIKKKLSFILLLVFFFNSFFSLMPSVSAVVPDALYLDINSDWQIDHIKVYMWNFPTQCIFETWDWTIPTAWDIMIWSIEWIVLNAEWNWDWTCDWTDQFIYLSVTADPNITWDDINPIIAYNNQWDMDSLLYETTTPFASDSEIIVSDGAAPIMWFIRNFDENDSWNTGNPDWQNDEYYVVFSEDIDDSSIISGDFVIDNNADWAYNIDAFLDVIINNWEDIGEVDDDEITLTTASYIDWTGMVWIKLVWSIDDLAWNSTVWTQEIRFDNEEEVGPEYRNEDYASPFLLWNEYEDSNWNWTVDRIKLTFSEYLDEQNGSFPLVSSDFSVTFSWGIITAWDLGLEMVETLNTDVIDDNILYIEFTNGIEESTDEDYEITIEDCKIIDDEENCMSGVPAELSTDKAEALI